jgi:NAD(P)H-dependent FMN reductase
MARRDAARLGVAIREALEDLAEATKRVREVSPQDIDAPSVVTRVHLREDAEAITSAIHRLDALLGVTGEMFGQVPASWTRKESA